MFSSLTDHTTTMSPSHRAKNDGKNVVKTWIDFDHIWKKVVSYNHQKRREKCRQNVTWGGWGGLIGEPVNKEMPVELITIDIEDLGGGGTPAQTY